MAPEWNCSGGFVAFLDHVGQKPGKGYSLDRIDNEKGYEPGNVRWATREEQLRNMRSNTWIERDGIRMIVVDFARAHSLHPNTVRMRLRRGQDPLTGERLKR